MTRLSVNINKLATLRNARGGDNPDVIAWTQKIQSYGAQGITIHPRPDQRHIRRSDVHALKRVVSTEFNIEGYPSREFLDLVKEVVPEQVTFVPDPPEVLTSNAGWDVVTHRSFLKDIMAEMRAEKIRTSVFMETDLKQMDAVGEIGADRIELYTESYATRMAAGDVSVADEYRAAADCAKSLGLGVNAGHDLDLHNLKAFVAAIPFVEEVSIGHALICDALIYGMEQTVQLYLDELA
jgi:pyridoxine 5-phosphate synthase